MTIVVVFMLVHLLIIRSGNCSQREKENQEHRCVRGQAVSNIEWTLVEKDYRTFRVDCVNISGASCDDKCEWSLSCTIGEYGPGLYTRGVNVLYDPNKDSQQYVLYLCCNKSASVGSPKCDTMMSRQYGVTNRDTSRYIREAHAPFPYEQGKMWWETCQIDNDHRQKRETTSSCHHHHHHDHVPFNYKLFYLAGLAGLAGLSGLALLRQQPITTTTPAPCTATCCNPDNGDAVWSGCAHGSCGPDVCPGWECVAGYIFAGDICVQTSNGPAFSGCCCHAELAGQKCFMGCSACSSLYHCGLVGPFGFCLPGPG